MKPKNFPARKLKRQLEAQKLNPDNFVKELKYARTIRTKKNRGV